MKIFDAQIRSDTRSDDDLLNLHYFETTRSVTTAHPAHAFERADNLLGYFEGLVTEECTRLRRLGLHPYVGLGLLPHGRPRRTHHEVWSELPFLLNEPEVVAVGEIGAWLDQEDHWELFIRQIALARDHGLAVIVTPPADLRVNMTYKMMSRIETVGLDPSMALMNQLDERLIEPVLREGFVAGISVRPSLIDPRSAAEAIVRAMESVGSADRIVLSSGLSEGSGDVLGIPKTIVALQEMGVDMKITERLVFGNAMKLFVR